MDAAEGEIVLKENRSNFVNRIGLLRRRIWESRCIAGIAIGIAIWGWCRPLNVIAERAIGLSNSDCNEYARTMCNN